MAWYCSGSTNAELVENLFKVELIKNERVKEAMLGVSNILHPVTKFSSCSSDTRSRLIEPTTLRRDPTRTRRSPSDMGPPSLLRTCTATLASTSSTISGPEPECWTSDPAPDTSLMSSPI